MYKNSSMFCECAIPKKACKVTLPPSRQTISRQLSSLLVDGLHLLPPVKRQLVKLSPPLRFKPPTERMNRAN